jgi:hypothetical protein
VAAAVAVNPLGFTGHAPPTARNEYNRFGTGNWWWWQSALNSSLRQIPYLIGKIERIRDFHYVNEEFTSWETSLIL